MGTRLQGIGASDGLFMGPVRCLSKPPAQHRIRGDAATEAGALSEAVALAVGELAALMDRVTGEAQDMLAFQVAMLEDEALSAPAYAAIRAGAAADDAWSAALDSEIAGYDSSGDEYFRARAADLKDMRDRVLRCLAGGSDAASPLAGCVLAGDDLAPTAFLEADWSQGGAIALSQGSATAHVAMLARARGIPMVVGLGAVDFSSIRTLIVNGGSGQLTVDPDAEAQEAFHIACAAEESRRLGDEAFRLKPALRRDGVQIDVLVNIATPDELAHIDARSCDGIGLMRSEFLFRDGAPLPGEDEQYESYRRLLTWTGSKPVTIRTLDIGGDKPIRGLTPEGETNPFLGLRGVRLTLARPEVFRTQLRALARAAVLGNLKIMIPMVTVPGEIAQTATLLHTCAAELAAEGIACRIPPLGIMVEVPAVAIVPDLFDEAAFFSIGSNDLTQYVTAASRDDARVGALNDPGHPAVLRLIASVAAHGAASGIPVSLCGDMASEPRHLKALLEAGLTSLSVAPARLARVKAAIAEL